MILAHQIALDLTADQERYCCRAAGTARFTYNWALAEWRRQYQAGAKPTAAQLKTQWNAIKHAQFPWVAAVHKDANQQPFAHLATAFHKFFRHEAQYPAFKKKGQHDSFYVSNDKCTIQGTRLRLPVLRWVRMREALRFNGQVMSVTISRVAHRWFASIAVRLEVSPMPCENQAVVGVDLGVNRLATLSTGEMVEGPKPVRRLLQALRRCSKGLSRKVLGSANRAKAKRKLARLHYRMACQRADALHKVTTSLVRRFGTVVIEDLHVKGMVKNRHLSRAISDMGLGMFRRLLTYKAEMAGVTVVVAERWFPSSKRCSQCECLNATLTLKDRLFHCVACGLVQDRDLNAALNLRQLPTAGGEVTPVDSAALATASRRRETALGEAGTSESARECTF
jgi:putative transposase